MRVISTSTGINWVVLEQNILLSQCLPSPRCTIQQKGEEERGLLETDYHPIKGVGGGNAKVHLDLMAHSPLRKKKATSNLLIESQSIRGHLGSFFKRPFL